MHIRQVAVLLGYGKPQVLVVFKNTLPMRLYSFLFPIEDLKLAVETAKGILRKERLDRQLAGQSSSSLFMNIRDWYNSRKTVMFNTQDRLDDKIDKLTYMMSKLTTQSSDQNRPFKLRIYQGKRRGKTRNYYEQGKCQNRYRSNSADRRMSYRGRGQYRKNYIEGCNVMKIPQLSAQCSTE